jgi:hypothetical protein
MFVSAERVLDVTIDVAQRRLTDLVRNGLLSEWSRSAYQGGLDDLLRVGPLGELAGTSRLVRVQFLDPVYRDEAMTTGMRWEAIGVTGGLFPVLDADINLSPEQGQSTRLTLNGVYRPPFGLLGVTLDKIVMHKVAELTMRSLLTSIAALLEGARPAEARTPPMRSRENGPQIAPG